MKKKIVQGPKIKAHPTVPVTKKPLPPPKKKSKRNQQAIDQDKLSRLKRYSITESDKKEPIKRIGMEQSVDTDPYQKLDEIGSISTEQRKQRLIDRLENPDKYKNEPTFLAPRKKKGGKITYKMTGGQVVDISYE